MLFKWIPNFVPNKVFIFGCGGTGSRVAPLVAQFVKSCAWVVDPEITLVDFDLVEEKNLSRQNFVSSDVCKNKAVVLASRYSKAFGINITPVSARFKMSSHTGAESASFNTISTLIRTQNRINNLFIICVDSPEARREIVEALQYCCGDSTSNVVIDAGNENDFGQVTVHGIAGAMLDETYAKDFYKLKKTTPVDCQIPYIPMDPKYYDNMVAVTTDSCAALDQSMAINCLMAVNIFSIVQSIYYVRPISFFRVNISLSHGAIPEYVSTDYFKQVEPAAGGRVSARLCYKSFNREVDRLLNDIYTFEESLKPKPKKVEVPTDLVEVKPLTPASLVLQRDMSILATAAAAAA